MAVFNVFPEHMVEPVGAHLDHHEVVPRLGLDQTASHSEPSLRHLEDLVEHEADLLIAEVRDVEDVVPCPTELLGDLDLQPLWEREMLGARGCEETGHPPTREL